MQCQVCIVCGKRFQWRRVLLLLVGAILRSIQLGAFFLTLERHKEGSARSTIRLLSCTNTLSVQTRPSHPFDTGQILPCSHLPFVIFRTHAVISIKYDCLYSVAFYETRSHILAKISNVYCVLYWPTLQCSQTVRDGARGLV